MDINLVKNDALRSPRIYIYYLIHLFHEGLSSLARRSILWCSRYPKQKSYPKQTYSSFREKIKNISIFNNIF